MIHLAASVSGSCTCWLTCTNQNICCGLWQCTVYEQVSKQISPCWFSQGLFSLRMKCSTNGFCSTATFLYFKYVSGFYVSYSGALFMNSPSFEMPKWPFTACVSSKRSFPCVFFISVDELMHLPIRLFFPRLREVL